MSQTHTEGRFTLYGLLEGSVASPEATEQLEAWVSLLASFGLHPHLRIAGTHFTLHAEDSETDVVRVGPDPARQIKETLEQLVQAVGPVEEQQLFSTLRSVEIRPGIQVRSVYALTSEDLVDLQQDEMDCETRPPAVAVNTTRERLRIAGMGLVVLAAITGICSLFIDIPGTLRGLWNRVAPLDAEALELDNGMFDRFVRLERVERGKGSGGVTLHMIRGPDYPVGVEARAALLAGAKGESRIAVEALLVGYLRCEVYAEDGKWLSTARIRVRALDKEEGVDVLLRLKLDPRPARLVLRP